MLIAIILVRAYGLLFPFPGITPREALLGYRGEVIRQTGSDETGRKFPLIFTSSQTYLGPISTYLVAFSETVFGKSELSVRFPFVIMSIIGLLSLWWVVSKLFDSKIAIWSFAILGLCPWFISLSLSPSEWYLYFNVLMIVGAILRRLFHGKAMWIWVGVFVFFIIIASRNVNFYSDPAIINGINNMRGQGSLYFPQDVWIKVFYNKSYYIVKLIQNILINTKWQFYFAQPDNNSIFGQSSVGLLLIGWIAPFVLCLIVTFREKKYRWLIFWWLFAIIPSILSYPSPNQEKIIFASLPIGIIAAIGMVRVKPKWRAVILLTLVINFMFFGYDYFAKEQYRESDKRCHGVEVLATWIQQHQNEYQDIYVSDSYCPDIGPILLYYGVSGKSNLYTGKLMSGGWINSVGNILIGQLEKWKLDPSHQTLLVLSSSNQNKILDRYHPISRTEKDAQPCFSQVLEVYNSYQKPIFNLYKSVNPKCQLL